MKYVSRENNIIKLKDGRILGYAEYGNPDGKPLFSFHGWPSSRFQLSVLNEDISKLNVKPSFSYRAKSDQKLLTSANLQQAYLRNRSETFL